MYLCNDYNGIVSIFSSSLRFVFNSSTIKLHYTLGGKLMYVITNPHRLCDVTKQFVESGGPV